MDSLADIPAVDQHAHPLELPPRGLGAEEFRTLFTEARRETARVYQTVFYRWAVRELAKVLELDLLQNFSELEGAVLSARASDPVGYTRRLLSRANLEALLLDTGYGGEGTLEAHEPLSQSPVFEIIGVESLAERILPEAESAKELLAAVEEKLLEAETAKGFKTVAAYRGGPGGITELHVGRNQTGVRSREGLSRNTHPTACIARGLAIGGLEGGR